jgi:hypothetical protein
MDPITIFLERLRGHPVQVFTGFLDETPYWQMYPGEITLKASCTLKRLLHTYYNPGLPYFISFLQQFGWTQGPQEGTAANFQNIVETSPFQLDNKKIAKAEEKLIKTGATPNEKGALNDTSLGRLLWAILFYIAGIQDENIYIESLPTNIGQTVSKLTKGFIEGQKVEGEQLQVFLKEIMGTSSQGSGGGEGAAVEGSGDVKDPKKVTEIMASTANKYHLPPEFVITTSLCECGWNQSEINGSNKAGATGWFQFTSSEPYGHDTPAVNFPQDAQDTQKAADTFCKAVVARCHGKMPSESEWNRFAFITVQAAGPPGEGYTDWNSRLPQAKKLITQYAKNASFGPGLEESGVETQRGTTDKSEKNTPGKRTRIDAMISEAATISNRNYPYAWGGGHASAGKPSSGGEGVGGTGPNVIGFDCSGSVAAVLAAGGVISVGSSVGSSGEFGHYQSSATASGPAPSNANPSVSVYYNSTHAWMTINGQYFSTGWNKNPKGGAGWGGKNPSEWPSASGSYESFHFTTAFLNEPFTSKAPPLTGGSTATEGEGKTGAIDPLVAGKVAAFTGEITFPTVAEMAEAQILSGQKALMLNVSLFPFVQQVAQASMRSFMSLPNGDFYAFYPDYFGEFGQHEPYWRVRDLEVLDGGINLNDEALATHVFAVGDNTWPANEKLLNELQSTASVNIFNAFGQGGIVDLKLQNLKFDEENTTPKAAKGGKPAKSKKGGLEAVMDVHDAESFLERYGTRPVVMDVPMVRSPMYEILLAYQGFCLAWSSQFRTPFKFTFMPELFPGGKVEFEGHGLQMYIEAVSHSWDLESGFTTDATLAAPSLTKGASSARYKELPEDMVSALVEPVRSKK